jgi:hypothetical protein
MNKTNKVLLVIAGIVIVLLCIVPLAMGVLGNLFNGSNSTPSPKQQEETLIAEEKNFPQQEPTSTPTEELLTLDPNFLNDPSTACFFHSGGLTCLDEEGWHIYDRDDFDYPLSLPHEITQCEDGRIFMKSIDLYAFNGETLEIPGLTSEEIDMLRDVEMLACGSGEELWVTHNGGVSHYDGSSWRTYEASQYFGSGDGVEHPKLISIALNGNVWVGTGDSIASYNGMTWQVFEAGQGFDEDPDPRDLAIDQDGNVWVISSYDTLLKFDGNQWLSFPSPGGMLDKLAIDANGTIWITSDKGILTFDPVISNWGQNYGLETFPEDYLTDLQFDQQGRLWVTSWYGIYVFDGVNWTIYQMHTADLYDNEPSQVVVLGEGPPLPALIEKEPGSISGTLVKHAASTFTNIQVEVCLRGVVIVFYGATPCSGQAFHTLGSVNQDGSFLVEGIPAGKYDLMVQLDADTWLNSTSFEVRPGQTTYLGNIDASGD